MKTIFKKEKKEEALTWIAKRIAAGSRNSATAIIKIHTICQAPEKNKDPKEFIDRWLQHLFSIEFFSSYEEWSSELLVTPKMRSNIEYLFFRYFASFTPIFFFNKRIKISRFKSYKWTKEDFNNLEGHIIFNWYKEEFQEYEKQGLEPDISLKNKIRNITSLTAAVADAKQSFFNSSDKLDFLLSTSPIEIGIKEQLPSFNHRFQEDLFDLHSRHFIKALPHALTSLEENFYEKGNYVHSFFQWNK